MASKRKQRTRCATHRNGRIYISCKGPLTLLHAVKAKRDLDKAIWDQIDFLDAREPVNGVGC